jgi:hypothetical protein
MAVEIWQLKYGMEPSEAEIDGVVRVIMGHADRNEDGVLDRDEFVKFCQGK